MNRLSFKSTKPPLKIVFLDRDGVINVFPGNGKYVTLVKNFQFLPGAREAIRALTLRGYTIFVVSNQAGVGKGIFSRDKLNRITRKMLLGVEKAGGKIKKVYYSTSRSDAGCPDRKPNIGSIKKALTLVKADERDLSNAFFVGDTQIDVQTGINAGCKTIFVLTGREDREYLKNKWTVRPDFIADDLRAAVTLILRHHGDPPSIDL
jgi:D-glycero-D-manno-heptose 1,7-bisphosphate phosphatase